jgi:Methyltransferase domain
MNSSRALLDKIRELMAAGVTYPPDLLTKFDDAKPYDQLNKSYLTQGGAAGGYHHWLTLLAKNADARLIVELGSKHGTSTLALYHGLQPGCRLVTVDTVVDQRYVPEFIFKDGRVNFVTGDCLDLSAYGRCKTDIPLDIDILWTDTVHVYDQVASEFAVYESLLADECLVAIDDIHLNDKGNFFQEMPYEKTDLTALCHGSGFGIFWYKRPAAERGRSSEERIRQAALKSMEIGYRRYWALWNDHDALTAKVQNNSVRGRLRKAKHLMGVLLLRR